MTAHQWQLGSNEPKPSIKKKNKWNQIYEVFGVENCLNTYYSTQQTLIFRNFKRLYAFESECL